MSLRSQPDPVVLVHSLEPSHPYCALTFVKYTHTHCFPSHPCRSIEYTIPQAVHSTAKFPHRLHLKLMGSKPHALSPAKFCLKQCSSTFFDLSLSFSPALSAIVTSKGQYVKNKDTQPLYFSFGMCLPLNNSACPTQDVTGSGWFRPLFWALHALVLKAEPTSHGNKVALISCL